MIPGLSIIDQENTPSPITTMVDRAFYRGGISLQFPDAPSGIRYRNIRKKGQKGGINVGKFDIYDVLISNVGIDQEPTDKINDKPN